MMAMPTPRAASSIPRERLVVRLDATGNHAPVVWLAAPAGSMHDLLLASDVEHRSPPCF